MNRCDYQNVFYLFIFNISLTGCAHLNKTPEQEKLDLFRLFTISTRSVHIFSAECLSKYEGAIKNGSNQVRLTAKLLIQNGQIHTRVFKMQQQSPGILKDLELRVCESKVTDDFARYFETEFQYSLGADLKYRNVEMTIELEGDIYPIMDIVFESTPLKGQMRTPR